MQREVLADGRSRVVKRLASDLPRPGQVASLLAEHALLVELADVPGLVRARALRRIAGLPVLVLEDAGTRTLADLHPGRPSPVERVVRVGAALAHTLGRMHEHGVVHRDVNPMNVVLRADGEPVLVDLGLATRFIGQRPAQQAPDRPVGTVAYMAPELTGRTGLSIDHRADLYGLGATLYRVATGRGPFAADTAAQMIQAHLATPAPELADVPDSLARLVGALLAKDPAARPSDAWVVVERLVGIADELGVTLPDRVVVAESRRARRLAPTRLIGRKEELATLDGILTDAKRGRGRMVIIEGPEGMGRTALARAAGELALRYGGLVGATASSSDRVGAGGGGLLGAVAYAWRMLGLREPGRVGPMHERVRDACVGLEEEAAAILPELSSWLSPRDRRALQPARSNMRHHAALLALLDALAPADRPLLLVLDDLQHASVDTVARLRGVVGHLDHLGVVIVGSVSRAPEGEGLVDRLRQGRAAEFVEVLRLSPLGTPALRRLCGEILGAPVDTPELLHAVVRHHSGGRPGRVVQLLSTLERGGVLQARPRSWAFDAEKMARLEPALSSRWPQEQELRSLPEDGRRALGALAIMGPQGRLDDLAALLGWTLRQAAAAVAEPLRRGLLASSTEAWRTGLPVDIDDQELAALDLRLTIVWQSLRDAAMAAVPPAARRRAHRFLAARLTPRVEGDVDALFACVEHLRAAGDRIGGGPERVAAARLAARAVCASLARGAGALAWTQARTGLAWAEAEPTTPTSLLNALRIDGAQAAWLSGHHDEAEALLEGAIRGCPPGADRVALDVLRVQLRTVAGRLDDALDSGRRALRGLGVDLPAAPDDARLEALRADFDRALAAAWPLTPDTLDRVARGPDSATMSLLQELVPAAWLAAPRLLEALVHHIAIASLSRGMSEASGFALAFEGARLIEGGEVERGRSLAQAVVDLGRERWRRRSAGCDGRSSGEAAAGFACEALFTFAHRVQHRTGALEDALPMLDEALVLAGAAGDAAWTGFVHAARVVDGWPLVSNLATFEARVDQALDLLERTGHRPLVALVSPYRQLCRWLRGRTDDALDDSGFSESRWRRDVADNPLARGVGAMLKLHGAVVFGRAPLARSLAADTEAAIPLLRGSYLAVERDWLAGMAAALVQDRVALRAAIARLADHASFAPANCQHKKRMLQAELVWMEGDPWAALEAFDEAAEDARDGGFLVDAALVLQRAALYLDEAGRRVAARAYAGRARQLWTLISAEGPAEALARRWPGVARQERERSVRVTTSTSQPLTLGLSAEGLEEGSATRSEDIDLQAIMQTAQALAAELDTDTLVQKVLDAAMTMGGARRVTLILAGPTGLVVEAALSEHGHEALGEPLIASRRVSRELVAESRQRRQPVVVGDALTERRLRQDPWVVRTRARSLLVVPAQRQQRLVAILYLENDLVPHAFTSRRVQALSLLGAQVAIALENARLFDRIRAETAERLETERRLLQAQRLETVGRLAAGVAHDFNNLLAVILGWAEHVQALLPDDSAVAAPLQQVVDTAERGSTLTRQLLAFSRQSVASPRPTDVARALSGIGALVNRLLGPGIQLQLLAGPRLPPVMIDPGLLEQVLINLLLNARDAMPTGGMIQVGCREQVDPEGLPPGRYVEVEVSDEGEGIAPDALERVFEPFFTTKGKQGTGLGLSTCRGIAEQSGGTIRVASTPGQGSRFTLLLPVSEIDANPEQPDQAGMFTTTGRVLLVEDDATVRQMMEVSLQAAGMEVRGAADGRAAMSLLDEGFRPEVLLTDLSMPGMSGVDVIIAARERIPGLPAVLLSGLAPGNLTEPLPARVVYRQKPVRMRKLVSLLASLRDGPGAAEVAGGSLAAEPGGDREPARR